MTFTQIKLPFAYESLEPIIDTTTMHVHYDKHHKTYTDKFNIAITENKLENKNIEELFSQISKLPTSIRNNGGGFWNHNFFFEGLIDKKQDMSTTFKKILETEFTSFDKFKELLSNAALNQFGSGWAWLGYNTKTKKLVIFSTPNQDNSLMDIWPEKIIPLLTIDVWEHAYYLKYQNMRATWISEFFKIINWKKVEERYQNALKNKW